MTTTRTCLWNVEQHWHPVGLQGQCYILKNKRSFVSEIFYFFLIFFLFPFFSFFIFYFLHTVQKRKTILYIISALTKSCFEKIISTVLPPYINWTHTLQASWRETALLIKRFNFLKWVCSAWRSRRDTSLNNLWSVLTQPGFQSFSQSTLHPFMFALRCLAGLDVLILV